MKQVKRGMGAAMLAVVFAAAGYGGAIRLPVGSGANTLAANDDDSTGAVSLGFSANFFGTTFSNVYVNNNGNVTFGGSYSNFTPTGLSTVSIPMIAAFFADVDTRGTGSGVVTYGIGTITDASLGWNNAPVFAIEWPNVGYFASQVDKLNSFEILLVARPDTGAGNFDIEFNYNNIQWETGGASGGTGGLGGTSAAVGYSNGSGSYYQLPGSLINGALLNGGPNALISHSLNSPVLGRYDLQVRTGAVVTVPTVPAGPTGAPEPATWGLIAAGLSAMALVRRRRG